MSGKRCYYNIPSGSTGFKYGHQGEGSECLHLSSLKNVKAPGLCYFEVETADAGCHDCNIMRRGMSVVPSSHY